MIDEIVYLVAVYERMGAECWKAVTASNGLKDLNARLDSIERRFKRPIDAEFREFVDVEFARHRAGENAIK